MAFQEVNIHDWIIEIDVEETKKQYLKKWDLCDCLDCLNFYKAVNTLPQDVLNLFTLLGVKPSITNHLSEFGPNTKGLHHYMGCYHIVGSLLKSPENSLRSLNNDDVIVLSENVIVYFSKELDFVPGFFPKPVLQLDFEMHIPWVLEEKP